MKKVIYLILACFCTISGLAQKKMGDPAEVEKIMQNTANFSSFIMASDYEGIADSYTSDGKLFPNNRDIIEGRKAIIDYWTLPEGVSITHHKVMPEEIKVTGDEAWDYGYYEGRTKGRDGTESSWKGKYVIIWRKEEGVWKMYLDIWNRVP